MARRKKRKGPTGERTVTTRAHVVHDPETSRAIWETCRQQTAAYNRAIEHLVDRPDEPLRRSTPQGIRGLYGRWLDWRAERKALADFPQTVWRGGVSRAHSDFTGWEQTNAAHCAAVINAIEKGKALPRRVQNRVPDPRRLFRSRKRADRSRRNHCRILEGVRKIDAHTVHVPGIGCLRVRNKLNDEVEPRAVTIREKTPAARGRNLQPEERTWLLYLHHRVPAPPTRKPMTSVGVDHGVVHAMTTCDNEGAVEHYSHDAAEVKESTRRRDTLKRKATTRCRPGSRKWRRRMRQARQVSRRQVGRNRHRQLQWANNLARHYDVVCVEDLMAQNLLRSARGTNEAPGKNVAAKRGLSRKLAGVAPRRMIATLDEACRRHGARFVAVDPHETSITCAQCGQVDPKSRKSQAVFECTHCGHKANADANAGEVIRQRGVGSKRAGVSRSGGPPGPEAPSSAAQRQESNRQTRKGRKGTSNAGKTARPTRAAAGNGVATEAAPLRNASRTYYGASRICYEN